ncbi:MAG: pectate lyase [Isosphaeraceae bacterium]
MRFVVYAALLIGLLAPPGQAGDGSTRDQAASALRNAVGFFRARVAVEGGYLWRYSEDLSRRQGEEKATATMAWVQPPGTPAVGLALLNAHEAAGDPYYLDAARETAHALVRGQLRSGGWDYSIEFDPRLRSRIAYRVDPEVKNGRNVSTLDDDTTQAALRLLMRIDRALKFEDAAIHESVGFALKALRNAQYPNGAWPQRFDRAPDPARFPVTKAASPDDWSRTYLKADYRGHYTLNDNTLADMIDVFLEAGRIYDRPEYQKAAERGGDFLLLAQMPEPQPAWAQQYDAEMHPVWARKFEPPSITGGESQGALKVLLHLYRETGHDRFLAPIPKALAYLRRSRLDDGRLARFYELKTNRPLYFTKDDYELTYSDANMPTHYAFKIGDGTGSITREYERLKANGPDRRTDPTQTARPRPSKVLETRAMAVVKALDDQGRWVEDGRLKAFGPDDPTRRVIDCGTFIRNVDALSRYLASTRP